MLTLKHEWETRWTRTSKTNVDQQLEFKAIKHAYAITTKSK